MRRFSFDYFGGFSIRLLHFYEYQGIITMELKVVPLCGGLDFMEVIQ